MIFPLCKWYFDINWHKFEKKGGPKFFKYYPNAIHLDPLQFCPSVPLLGFPVFCLSSSIVLNRYFHILVNSVTIWSVLKLPKIVWPSPFKQTDYEVIMKQLRDEMKGEIKNLATETVSVIDTNMSLIQDFLHGVFDFQSLYHLDSLFRYCYKKSYFFTVGPSRL